MDGLNSPAHCFFFKNSSWFIARQSYSPTARMTRKSQEKSRTRPVPLCHGSAMAISEKNASQWLWKLELWITFAR